MEFGDIFCAYSYSCSNADQHINDLAHLVQAVRVKIERVCALLGEITIFAQMISNMYSFDIAQSILTRLTPN